MDEKEQKSQDPIEDLVKVLIQTAVNSGLTVRHSLLALEQAQRNLTKYVTPVLLPQAFQ